MKKFWAISLILFLIVTTTLIKNTTKNLEDQIFTKRENIRILKKELSDLLLEYNYLSSAEKLMQYQTKFFEEELIQKKLEDFQVIENNIEIKKITKIDE
ncbi:cell division protein FtsL [Candidatus Pelagibacter sp.]|uniref:cell division protein FtsL n=1 Tax=Candidatus Pelagibacter sp. TaxID=2024849 RepID=UPI003F87C066